MTFLADTLSWILKRRMPRIEAMYKRPIELQEGVISDLVFSASSTEWGKKYEYSSITKYSEFRERVPISTYEEVFPYIQRMLNGEQNILWASPITYFAKSSGTTNARSKFIPVSRESLAECHMLGGKDMLTLLVNNRPNNSLFDGKGLSIGGSLDSNPLNNHSMYGDVSAVIMKNLPIWAQLIRTPSLEVALMNDWETKIQKMAEETSKQNVTSILGVPTWTIVLIERILEITQAKNILEVWPNFEMMIHGAVAFGPYRELFQKEIFPSSSVSYLEIYNASEGFFAIQDDLSKNDEMLLMLDYGIFYEFIPMDEYGNESQEAISLQEVECGVNYAMVISTNAGLWRYKIGDTVRFTSIDPFRIKISGRTKHFINAFGEELIIENADSAITFACKKTNARLKDYTAAPSYMEGGKQGFHEWVIEFETMPSNLDDFIHFMDQKLKELNSDYEAKRSYDMVLKKPHIHFAAAGTFYQWMENRGKLGGQHKVPRLSNNREFIDQLLNIIKV